MQLQTCNIEITVIIKNLDLPLNKQDDVKVLDRCVINQIYLKCERDAVPKYNLGVPGARELVPGPLTFTLECLENTIAPGDKK